MNAARPEAETEYSRGHRTTGGDPGRRHGVRIAVFSAGLIGASLLAAAEFTPLLRVRSSAAAGVIDTVATGSHHSYALLPVALLAAVLAYGVWQSGSRLALLATGLLGLVALLIALLGDLPDAQASGLIGSAATRFFSASSTPSIGLYLETLGAIVLLIAAATGLFLTAQPDSPGPRGRNGVTGASTGSARTRSAS